MRIIAKILKRAIKYIFLIYIATGLIYYVTGYIYRAVAGKQEVFSLLIGIPSCVISWPWMVYADLKHIGVMPQDVLVFLSLAVCIAVFVRKEVLLKNG